MGIEIVRGHGFTEEEYGAALSTYVVNETLVKQSGRTAAPATAVKHQGSLGAQLSLSRFGAGVTLALVGERADSDFLGRGLTTSPGYARLDARLRVVLTAALEAYLGGDNLLDEEYQEALGYPALGRAVRGGLRLRLGGGARP